MVEASSPCALGKNAKKTSSCCKGGAAAKTESKCCFQQLQAEQPVLISFNFSNTVINHVSFNVFSIQPGVIKSKYNLAYLDGPPGPISVAPRYISFRSFRV